MILIKKGDVKLLSAQAFLSNSLAEAIEVHAMPKSEYDWEVMSAFAEAAERLFLKQVSVLFLGQGINLQLTASLSVTLVITTIKTSSWELSCPTFAVGGAKDSSANHNESTDRDFCNTIKAARLTANTTVVVAPYTRCTPVTADVDSADTATLVNGNQFSSSRLRTAPTREELRQRTKDLRKCANNLPPLIVVPQMFRNSDCDCGYEVDSVDEPGQSLDVESVVNKQGYIRPDFNTDLANDNSTGYIHPLHLLAAQEMTLQRSNIGTKDGTEKVRVCTCIDSAWKLDDGNSFFAAVYPGKITEKLSRPLSENVVIRIVVTVKIRPFHISLPSVVWKCLLLQDFDSVNLQILSESDCRPRRPSAITLTRISWQKVPDGDVDPRTADKSSIEDGKLTHFADPALPSQSADIKASSLADGITSGFEKAVSRAFARHIRHEVARNGSCSFSHGCVVTLSMPSSACSQGERLQNGLCNGSSDGIVNEDFILYLRDTKNSEGSTKESPTPILVQFEDDDVALDSILNEIKVSAVKRVYVSEPWLNNVLWKLSCEVGMDFKESVAHLEGMGVVTRTILGECCLALLPRAVLERTRACVLGPTGVLVTGTAGTGKSELLMYVGQILQRCPRTMTYLKMVRCASLRGIPMQLVLSSLSAAFQEVSQRAPSMLLLDDLDALCPKRSDDAADQAASTQASTIAQHLEELLRNLVLQRQQSHYCACALDKLLRDTTDDRGGYIDGDAASRLSGLSGFRADRVVGLAMHGTVFVIATAQSSDVDSRLLSPAFLHRSIPIPALREEYRLDVLRAALRRLGASLVPATGDVVDKLNQCTDGFRVGDLVALARRCFMSAIRDDSLFLEDVESTIVIKCDDVLNTVNDFSPMSSSLCSTNLSQTRPKVGWDAIGGLTDAITALKNTFQLPLLFRKLYQRCPIKIPRGMLLYGPPGCGKTLIAEAAGRECGMTFIAVKGPQLLDKYIGGSEKAMRELFDRAKASGRVCLIFFDEFEAVAPKRGNENSGVTDRVVNQLLTFLDGVEDTLGSAGDSGSGMGQVYVLAATSRPDMVDTALLRPGRIERHVYVGLPSAREREQILRVALRTTACADDMDQALTGLARDERMEGMTGADLQGLVNSAVLLAIHECIDIRTKTRFDVDGALEMYCADDGDGVDNCYFSGRSLEESIFDNPAISTRRTTAPDHSESADAINYDHKGEIAGNRPGLTLTMAHLQRALVATRPSISTTDVKFYEEVHSRFRQSWRTETGQETSSFPAADMGDDVTKQRVTFK